MAILLSLKARMTKTELYHLGVSSLGSIPKGSHTHCVEAS